MTYWNYYAPGGQVKSSPFEGASDVDLAAMPPWQIVRWLARRAKFKEKGVADNVLPGGHSKQDATRQGIESAKRLGASDASPPAVTTGPWRDLPLSQASDNRRFRWPREDNQIPPSVPGRPQAFSPLSTPSSEVVPFNPPRPNPFQQGYNEWFAKNFPEKYPGADIVNHPSRRPPPADIAPWPAELGPKIKIPPRSQENWGTAMERLYQKDQSILDAERGAEVIKPKFGRQTEPGRGPADIIEYPPDPYRADGGSVDGNRMKLPGRTTEYATGDPVPERGPAPARFPSVVRDWSDFFSGLGRDAKKLFSPQDYSEGGTVEEDIQRSREALDRAWEWIGRPPSNSSPVAMDQTSGSSTYPTTSGPYSISTDGSGSAREMAGRRLGFKDRHAINQPERFDIKGSNQLAPELLAEQYWPTPSMRSHERPWKQKYFTDPMTDAIMWGQRTFGKGEDAYKARHVSEGVYSSFTNPASLPGALAGLPQMAQNAWQLKDEIPNYLQRRIEGKPAHLDWSKAGETFGTAAAIPFRQAASRVGLGGFRPDTGAGRVFDQRPQNPFQLQPMPNAPMAERGTGNSWLLRKELSPQQQYQVMATRPHGKGISTTSPVGHMTVTPSGNPRMQTINIDKLDVPTKQLNDRMMKSLINELEFQYPSAVRLNKFNKPLGDKGKTSLEISRRDLTPYDWGYKNPEIMKRIKEHFFYTDPRGLPGNANGGRAYKDGGRVEGYVPFWARG